MVVFVWVCIREVKQTEDKRFEIIGCVYVCLSRVVEPCVQQAQSLWDLCGCSSSWGPCLLPVTVGSLLSRLSDILSQMMSTSRSNVCFTFMLSLALVSKNSKPAAGWKRRLWLTLIVPRSGAYPVNLLISSCQRTLVLRLHRHLEPHPFSDLQCLHILAKKSLFSGLQFCHRWTEFRCDMRPAALSSLLLFLLLLLL